jgi:DNA-binding transcriptional regulator WhiA
MEFLVRKNELILFSADEKAKSRFVIQQMTLRADWDRAEARRELEAKMMERSVNYESRNPPRTSMASANAR